jgi:hypothetical protein
MGGMAGRHGKADPRLGAPRAWEALSGRLPTSGAADQGPRRLTAADRWRPLWTAAWGTSGARSARTNVAQT